MSSDRTITDVGERKRYVFTTIVRCPGCGSDSYKVYGHQPNSEALTQYARCKQCQFQFFVVHEESDDSFQQR